jgi:hypothetical protein
MWRAYSNPDPHGVKRRGGKKNDKFVFGGNYVKTFHPQSYFPVFSKFTRQKDLSA